MQINDPAVSAELMDRHAVYERALMENDVATLKSLFWNSAHAVRYGVGENLYGAVDIHAFRQARSRVDLNRSVTRLEITALGDSAGVINLEFMRHIDGAERKGRQTQFWVRFPEGWRIVSAHISLLPGGPPAYLEAAAARIGLPVNAAHAAAVATDLNRIADIAQFLMEFPLAQDVEAAPVFQA